MEIREKLENLRISKNLTQDRLAEKLNISPNSIKNYESFAKCRIPDYNVLKKYVEFFNVSYDYLLDENIKNHTAENIQIEKKLKLSDKAISNLENFDHKGIDLILEKDYFEELNNLLDLYTKFATLLFNLGKINTTSKKTFLLHFEEIIELYDSYVEDNDKLLRYTSNFYPHDDDFYLDVYEDDEIELEIVFEELNNTFDSAIRSVKLELLETFFKLLNSITN